MDCCGHEGPGSGDARFEIKKVADGVHVAVAAPAYKVNSNTALIESDGGVIVVDTHSKPSAARVIIERLRDLTPKPVRYVVNTHFHWDHWHGNEAYPAAYPDAEIVTNEITREAMVKKGLGLREALLGVCRVPALAHGRPRQHRAHLRDGELVPPPRAIIARYPRAPTRSTAPAMSSRCFRRTPR